jgi:hypothetical protein
MAVLLQELSFEEGGLEAIEAELDLLLKGVEIMLGSTHNVVLLVKRM